MEVSPESWSNKIVGLKTTEQMNGAVTANKEQI